MLAPGGLFGTLVGLRSVRPDDYRLLDQWIVEASSPFWTSLSFAFYSYKQYLEFVASGGLTQFASVVADKASEAPIGLIRISNLDTSHGHATIETFMAEEYRPKRHGFHAFCLLVNYLTEALNLRKVYVATYEGFDHLGLGGWSDFFQEEARFPEHLLFRGTLVELRLLALYAERWRELRKIVWTEVQGGSSPRGAQSRA